MTEYCNYTFTHKSNGKKIISQSWAEFYELQSNKEYDQSYHRLGTTEFKAYTNSIYQTEEKINKFFSGAKGYEQTGNLNCNGVTYNVLRVFLKVIHNHACMIGDKITVESTKEMDKWFYHNSNHSRLLLPQ